MTTTYPNDEAFRAIAARIALANEHILALGLIMRALGSVLPPPSARNVEAAQAGLEAAIQRVEHRAGPNNEEV